MSGLLRRFLGRYGRDEFGQAIVGLHYFEELS